jgi:hypothetical protein
LNTALLVPKIAYALGSEFHYLYNNPQARTDLINATANLFIENAMFLQDVQALHPRALQKIAKDAATLKEIIKYTGEALYYATAEDITQWTAEQIALFTEIPFLFTKAFGKLIQASKLPQPLLPEAALAEEISYKAGLEIGDSSERFIIDLVEIAPGEYGMSAEGSKLTSTNSSLKEIQVPKQIVSKIESFPAQEKIQPTISSTQQRILISKVIDKQKPLLQNLICTAEHEADLLEIRSLLGEILPTHLPSELKAFLQAENIPVESVGMKITHVFETSLGEKKAK